MTLCIDESLSVCQLSLLESSGRMVHDVFKILISNVVILIYELYPFRIQLQNGMGFKTNGSPDYVDLGDWSGETCFVDCKSCEKGNTETCCSFKVSKY